MLHFNAGPAILQRCSGLDGIDFEALSNFAARTLAKLEASDDESE